VVGLSVLVDGTSGADAVLADTENRPLRCSQFWQDLGEEPGFTIGLGHGLGMLTISLPYLFRPRWSQSTSCVSRLRPWFFDGSATMKVNPPPN
jgi:hypothetical protein